MTRRMSSLLAWVMFMVVVLAGAPAIHAQEEPPAVTSADQLLAAAGIEAPILAQAEIDGASITGSTLLLELIELAPATEMAPHDTTSPELFSVLSGLLVFRDNFGFASLAEAGSTISLNSGTQYTIANEDSEPGRLLRLRVAGGEDSGPSATPTADAGGAAVLAQIPLQDLQVETARIYLARVQFGTGADTGEQEHAGPLGIYVESGAINVVSPSGLVGTIGEGQAVSLPVETPLHASIGETEAVAYIAGVSGPDGVAFERVASADGSTASDSVLGSGETWRTETAEMAIDFIQHNNSMEFAVTYINRRETGLEFSRPSDFSSGFLVTDAAGERWRQPSSDCPYRETLEPGGSIACSFTLYPPRNTTSGQIVLTVTVGSFGDVQDARWQAEIDW